MRVLIFILLILICDSVEAQDYNCEPTYTTSALSERLANYKMHVRLDPDAKTATGTSQVTWVNNSPDTVSYLRMYMYLNAFSNMETSMLSHRRGAFGQDLSNRKEIEWGSVSVISPTQDGGAKELETVFVQPDDNNKKDKTVLQVDLEQAVLPGASTTIDFNFVAKLPKTIARSGYGENEFFHFVHWYPKLGVYEQDIAGVWDWNCHQFLPRMEFYGAFGNYDVTLEVPERFVIGASGCREIESRGEGDYKVIRHVAEDVIDFAWCASPLLEVVEDRWEHVEIRLLSAKAHKGLRKRLIDAAKHGLTYLKDHVGEYPYTTLTILDPPMHGLRSGFMEYPTYITGGAFHAWPKGLKTIESLIIHELSHQYYMQMLANNEKEDPWLDEGFVTFSEDRIMESAYGEEASLIDIMGFKASNSEFTRNEFVKSMPWRSSPIATHSWKFEGAFKENIYSKTATMLQTLRMHLGDEDFDIMMKRYFETNKFSHPRRHDFIKEVKTSFEESNNILSPYISEFMIQALDSTTRCDYMVENVMITKKDNGDYNNEVVLKRIRSFIAPVEVQFTWSDNATSMVIWDGRDREMQYDMDDSRYLTRVDIDPSFKLPLDIHYNNNIYVVDPPKVGVVKYASRALFWVQNALQASSFLM